MQSNSCWYRSMLQCSLVVAVLVAAYSDVHSQEVSNASNPVVLENQLPGSSDWQLTRVRVDGSRYRSTWIEGYCSKQSVRVGETIDIKVSTSPARSYRLEVFRTGYYGGAGARRVANIGPLHGQTQPTPEPGEKDLH